VPFASGLSEHPVAAHAVGEALGQVLDALDGPADLALVFVTAPHVGAFEDIAGAVREVLDPGVLLGASASSIVGGAREVEERPALSLWVGRFGPVTPVRLATIAGDGGWTVTGFPTDATATPQTLLLLADPFSFPTDGLLAQLATSAPDLAVVGGLASAARGPGGNRLLLDDEIHTAGAVGVLLPPDRVEGTVVSQGCRPIGDPFVVTRAEQNIVYELGGQPAVDRREAIVDALDPAERELVAHGLHVGRVIDESQVEFGPGDFLIRNLGGVDHETGAIAVGELVDVGATLQFQVRDALSADEDLRALLAGHDADGALVFTCNGRGTNLFDRPHHDAEVVSQVVDGGATAGLFCAGEIGPLGGPHSVHGFTAAIALFTDA
jgi:small ligand-binding sensory domain FIST